MSTPPVRNFLSSGANPVLARLCDKIAQLGGRLLAAVLDDIIHELERGDVAPRDAVERVLHRYGEADAVLLQRMGATHWPPSVQMVPTDRPGAAAAPSAGPATGPGLRTTGGPQTRSFSTIRRAA